jgi:hypothetical protein
MAVTYGFFNSLNQDRLYNADQMSEYFKGLISDGVFESVGNALQVIVDSGMSVNVQTGRAIIDCKWIENDALAPVTITQAHPTLNRYSAVVIRLNRTNRLMEFGTVDGTPASNPAKPSMTNTPQIVEKCLAYIYVAAGATAITAADIQDTRSSGLCGWVTGLIDQVDTSTLFDQYVAAYEQNLANMQAWEQVQKEQFQSWFSTLTDELLVNTHIERTYADVTTADLTRYVNFPAALDYEEGDIIDVYINGVYLSPTEYTIMENEVDEVYMIRTTNALDAGNVVNFSCLKSVIGNTNIIAEIDDINGEVI